MAQEVFLKPDLNKEKSQINKNINKQLKKNKLKKNWTGKMKYYIQD